MFHRGDIQIADENGLDGAGLLAQADGEVVRAEHAANTQRAIDAQIFGFPTYVYRGELFWGQDRVALLEETLTQGGLRR